MLFRSGKMPADVAECRRTQKRIADSVQKHIRIGRHFPDTDERYKGADSLKLLEAVVNLLKKEHWSVNNIDATVLAQAPKLAPFIPQMRENIAHACRLPVSAVSVKATTEEGLGFTGAKEGIAAHAVCLITEKQEIPFI